MKKLKQANFHQPRDFGSSIDYNIKMNMTITSTSMMTVMNVMKAV